MSLNAFTVFLGSWVNPAALTGGNSSPISKQVTLSALLARVQRSMLSAREEQNPLTERQSTVFFLSLFFTFPVGMCRLWVSEAAVLCAKQQQTAFPWDKGQTQTIQFWL